MQPSAPISDMENVICPNCGASLSYKPGTVHLVCEHCGSSFEIKTEVPIQNAQTEHDLVAAMTGSWQTAQQEGHAVVLSTLQLELEPVREKPGHGQQHD